MNPAVCASRGCHEPRHDTAWFWFGFGFLDFHNKYISAKVFASAMLIRERIA